jgi:hypothetical protein
MRPSAEELALPACTARQAEAAGGLGLVGHVLLAVGNVLLIGFAVGPLFNPSIKGLMRRTVWPPQCWHWLLLDFLLTAVATLRAGAYPRWSGILLLVAGIGFLADFFVAEDLPSLAGQASGTNLRAVAGVSVGLDRGRHVERFWLHSVVTAHAPRQAPLHARVRAAGWK